MTQRDIAEPNRLAVDLRRAVSAKRCWPRADFFLFASATHSFAGARACEQETSLLKAWVNST